MKKIDKITKSEKISKKRKKITLPIVTSLKYTKK